MVFADFGGWWGFGQWGTVGGDYIKSDKTSFAHQCNVRKRMTASRESWSCQKTSVADSPAIFD